MPDSPPPEGPLLCLDVGSTWTKAALVGPGGELLDTAQHPTTPPEVLEGIAAVTARLRAAGAPVLACSSAGGGLRLAVVGQEPLVSAEAGRRVALSAGARVVHVHAGALGGADLRALRAARPDVVLLAGGTDGGDSRTLLHNAARLAVHRLPVPVVLAGNAAAREDALALLRATGRTVVPAANVLPDVGELNPGPAREAIRAVFLRHVIGGKGLSRGPRFRRLVRLVTPDAMLVGVGVLASVLGSGPDGSSGSVLVVDVGGATTDVYSVVSPDAAGAAAEQHAVALPAQRRTVEGDLGLRISAGGVAADALTEKLVDAAEAAHLRAAAHRRAANPSWVPAPAAGIAGAVGAAGVAGDAEAADDARLAALAAILAVRRHLRMIDNRLGPRGAGLLVLAGGAFRHAAPGALATITATLRDDPVVRPVLRHARLLVDTDYVLAPAGLLAHAGLPAAAGALVRRLTP